MYSWTSSTADTDSSIVSKKNHKHASSDQNYVYTAGRMYEVIPSVSSGKVGAEGPVVEGMPPKLGGVAPAGVGGLAPWWTGDRGLGRLWTGD